MSIPPRCRVVPCRVLCSMAAVLALVHPAQARDPVGAEPSGSFKVAGTDPNIAAVPQGGRSAALIRDNLKRIRLPAGFRIELYALVPGVRHMAVAPGGGMLFVGTRRNTVWAVTDRDGDGVADEVLPFAPGLKFNDPNGVCWSRDGALVVVERNRVLAFAAAESFRQRPDVTVIPVVGQGRLVPPEEESPNHAARTCRVSDDGKLYITLGQPFNVQPRDKVALYERLGIGGVIRLNLADGSGREVVARGVRNSVGIDINPKDGTVWFTDNQTDQMGDDTPPGELNRITRAGGEHFGYPYVHGNSVQIAGTAVAPDLAGMAPPAQWTKPQVEFPAHQAQLGMTFYSGRMFPAAWHGGIFVAARGSWNRSRATGALVNFVPVKADGTAGASTVFAEGWLDPDTGAYRGRPVDVAVLKDGSLLVSDDQAGAIYRITWAAP